MADVTVVGQGLFLRGSIRGEGDLEIRGRIEGDVEVTGEVTIADGALIKADITARRITVRGAVAGNLTGEEGVRLEDGARVVGDVRGAAIGITERALLRGNVQTGARAEGQKGRSRAAARPAVRGHPRHTPPPAAVAAKPAPPPGAPTVTGGPRPP